MILLGIGVGMSFGWHRMDSLFLGGMIAMSSTTIIYKAFDDLGLRKTVHRACVKYLDSGRYIGYRFNGDAFHYGSKS